MLLYVHLRPSNAVADYHIPSRESRPGLASDISRERSPVGRRPCVHTAASSSIRRRLSTAGEASSLRGVPVKTCKRVR